MSKKKIETIEKNDDAPLGYSIKRIERKYVEHKSKLLINGSNRIAILGTSGSGKSTLLLQLIPMFSNLTKKIIYCSIKDKDDAQTSISNWCAEEKIKYIKCNTEEEAIKEIEQLINEKPESEHDIIIFDDFSLDNGGSVAKAGSANNIMTICSQVLRSYQISMIFVTQTYYNLPTRLRENLNLTFVFQMKNKYSIDAWLHDTIGQFYDGSNEDKIKRDIKEIYKHVFNDTHNWIMVTSNPSQIREKWNKIVYPPEMIGEISGGKKKMNNGLKKRFELIAQAKGLGLPSWKTTTMTNDALNEFIDASNKNENEKLDELIENENETIQQLYSRFLYYIRNYKLKSNPKLLNKISEYANLLSNEGFDMRKIKNLLQRNHMTDLIDVDE